MTVHVGRGRRGEEGVSGGRREGSCEGNAVGPFSDDSLHCFGIIVASVSNLMDEFDVSCLPSLSFSGPMYMKPLSLCLTFAGLSLVMFVCAHCPARDTFHFSVSFSCCFSPISLSPSLRSFPSARLASH